MWHVLCWTEPPTGHGGANVGKANIGEEANGVLRHAEQGVLSDHSHIPMRTVPNTEPHPNARAYGDVRHRALCHVTHLVVLCLKDLIMGTQQKSSGSTVSPKHPCPFSYACRDDDLHVPEFESPPGTSCHVMYTPRAPSARSSGPLLMTHPCHWVIDGRIFSVWLLQGIFPYALYVPACSMYIF